MSLFLIYSFVHIKQPKNSIYEKHSTFLLQRKKFNLTQKKSSINYPTTLLPQSTLFLPSLSVPCFHSSPNFRRNVTAHVSRFQFINLHRILKHRKAKKFLSKKNRKRFCKHFKIVIRKWIDIKQVQKYWSRVGDALSVEKTQESDENDKKRKNCRRAKIRKEKRRKIFVKIVKSLSESKIWVGIGGKRAQNVRKMSKNRGGNGKV